jgi:hypothetical protein
VNCPGKVFIQKGLCLIKGQTLFFLTGGVMKAQEEKGTGLSEKELFVKMALDAWETQNLRVDKLLSELTDEQLKMETATGRNSGGYLIGHLTAVNDGLLTILGLDQRLYPQLEEVFLKSPEKSVLKKPSMTELKKYWNEVNTKLKAHFEKLTADDWFDKHVAISAEDFAKEPHRNKLNVLISRTNHQSYHLGQLNFLAKK